MLGISPHTVDQRILLARAKLQVASRNEVAQAYRHLLIELGVGAVTGTYQQPVYGSPDIAEAAQTRHTGQREAADGASSEVHPSDMAHSVQAMTHEANRGYYHVLPEAFDGPGGTLLRLGAIAMITVFLTLVILGGLTMYMQLSHLLVG